jgi:nucleotide-binding universal stress UspA family protein
MRITTILCPVDRSPISDRAMAYATAVSREFAARLSVLEVIDWRLPPMAHTSGELLEIPPEIQVEALAHLNRVAAPARDGGVATEVAVDAGPVVAGILNRATDIGADLVVIGTHGRGGFDRLALGSVAEKVLRKAGCPVLTVPPGAAAGLPSPLFATVLCAVDFSPPSVDAVRAAGEIARRWGGRLLALHVPPWPFGDATSATASVLKRDLEDEAREQLRRLVAHELPPPAVVSALLEAGTPRDEILACAQRHHADLIVLGVSGHGAVDRAILGSTAHAVVRHSQCPVLTVRAGS